ncbi:hypothetical protein [Nocardia spumae]|uniref:hypothetical protein n=1 Tax=Nocardia spumae TaxID=2887190 RepID=UPI001D139CDB|nr:hypothetical protein [Nocardia spumae]
MRDFMGAHVSQINKYGHQEDVDGVFVTTSVRGSFKVRYAESIDRLVVAVEPGTCSDMSMQLTLDQAILMRDLLDAGIADMQAAQAVEVAQVLELPAGGDAA